MLVMEGKSHLSAAQIAKALVRVNAKLATPVEALSVTTVHYLGLREGATGLDAEQQKQVDACLSYGYPLPRVAGGTAVTVIPRPGTTTPWSSKATEILALCLHPSPVERIEHGARWEFSRALSAEELQAVKAEIHDKMTHVVVEGEVTEEMLFAHHKPKELRKVPLTRESLEEANVKFGLALQADEMDYIVQTWPHEPTDAELMMFAQVNSEHCRHKIFNAEWTIDGAQQEKSLFQMIKNTHKCNSAGVLSAYKDNAAVLEGPTAGRFFSDRNTKQYGVTEEPIHIVCKVETHNHPTAVSPFAGAATGSGGEIRDEGATGIGGKPKAGLCGFSVSHLHLPGAGQPWEDTEIGKPGRIASAQQIMLDAPIGAARFNNEFGRPNVCGYFRSFLQDATADVGEVKGYHKPIMLAGGLGNIRGEHVEKKPVGPGCHVVVLGGPSMLIGLGGGAASSMAQGTAAENVDFASVQRDNAELERRCQEVIDGCWQLGAANPILCIHDVGAGGLSNAIPEVLHDSGNGGRIDLRKVPNAEMGMSPMEIWCNEAQERYVIACDSAGLARFEELCKRERCPYAVVGETTAEQHLIVHDPVFGNNVVDVPMGTLFGKPPRMSKSVATHVPKLRPLAAALEATPDEALLRVLANPTVASKNFLITIGDRSVTGLVARDQLVGRWQVPVADVAVTCSSYDSFAGEAMAVGERTPVAVISGPASAGLAVGEALTNILAADVQTLKDVRFSANWMVNSGSSEEDYKLYRTVEKIGMDLVPKLGICIPVGKDSMSMKTIWEDNGKQKKVSAPLSVVISAFSPVADVRRTLTPALKRTSEKTVLALVDLAGGRTRLGGSILAQCYRELGDEAADLESCDALLAFAKALPALRKEGLLLAYHDKSDGGLAAAVAEMCFAGRVGADISVAAADQREALAQLFNEELGVVVQVREADLPKVRSAFAEAGLPDAVKLLGDVTKEQRLKVSCGARVVIDRSRAELQRVWAETSFRLQALRDNADCAQQEFDAVLDDEDPGLFSRLTFDIPRPVAPAADAPKMAILREQGVNGHVEMAWAFRCAGFNTFDIHMSDVLSGSVNLTDFRGLACCGGFSYGDTFGAGRGWASTIKGNKTALDAFSAFFNRKDTFALGICNGCQMLGSLWDLIPGAQAWPQFTYNESTQFEARVSMVEVQPGNPSIFFKGMEGSAFPVAVSHGEGRAAFRNEGDVAQAKVPLRYVDSRGRQTQAFPANPNGSPQAIAGVCSEDGRVTALMPHPERVLRTVTHSWSPDTELDGSAAWGDYSPWMKFFANARKWCDETA